MNRVMKKPTIKSICICFALIVLCMYAANPFFFRNCELLNKMLYYAFCLLSVAGFVFRRNNMSLKIGAFGFIVYLLFYSLVVVVISIQGDNTYVVYYVRLMQRFLGMITVVLLWRKAKAKRLIKIQFGEVYALSILLYMCSTFAFIINPALKMKWNSMIVSEQELYLIEWSRFSTRFGFAGWSSFNVSIWCLWGLIYLYFMYINSQIEYKKFLSLSILIVIGSVMYARSGIILSLLMMFIIIFNELRKGKINYFGHIICITTALFMLIGILGRINAHAQEALDWMFEFVNNFISTGSISSSSTNELLLMYNNFSPSIKTLLFGDGKWNLFSGGYYGNVDVGILRNILFGGIIYTVFEYGIGIYFLKWMNKLMSRNKANGKRLIPFMVGIILFCCELKGDLLFYNLKLLIPFVWIIPIMSMEDRLDEKNIVCSGNLLSGNKRCTGGCQISS